MAAAGTVKEYMQARGLRKPQPEPKVPEPEVTPSRTQMFSNMVREMEGSAAKRIKVEDPMGAAFDKL